MKALRKSILAATFLTMLIVRAYGTTPFIKVTSYDLKKFFVIVKNSDDSQISIILKDVNNTRLYKETYTNTNDKGYLKGFDLEPLSDGKYFLEIENNHRIELYSLSIIDNKLSIEPDSRLVIHKPNINQKGNKVDVAFWEGNGTPLKLLILDKTNNIIFEETVADNGNQAKTYDMSRLDPGSYIMRIDIAGRYFSQSIRIQ